METLKSADPARTARSVIECVRLYRLSGHCLGQLNRAQRRWAPALHARCVELRDTIAHDVPELATSVELAELAQLAMVDPDCRLVYIETLSAAASVTTKQAGKHDNDAAVDFVLLVFDELLEDLLRQPEWADLWDGVNLTLDRASDRHPRAAVMLAFAIHVAWHCEQARRGRATAMAARLIEAIPDLQEHCDVCRLKEEYAT